MQEGLKPCPFCDDGADDLSIRGDSDECYVQCDPCGTRGPYRARGIGDSQYDKAIAAWNALSRRLRWTKEKPTTCDFYWYRSEGGSIEIGIVYADVIGNLCIHFAGEEEPHLLELVDGEWAGPIPEPEEAE